MYQFLRKPRWILAHLIVIAMLFVFAMAGSWQLRRHADRQDRNDAVTGRTDLEPLGLADLADLDPAEHEYRSVTIVGRWRPDDLVLIRNRSHQSTGGCHVAVPFDGGGARSLLVAVGWLAQGDCTTDPFPDVTLPDGDVELLGRLRASQVRGSFGATDPAEGRLLSLARTDVARVDQQVELDLAAMYAELVEATPPVEGVVAIDAPATDSGPHLGYAVQWFLFFAVTLVGYPLVLRHEARRGDLDDIDDVPVDDPTTT
jgi:cytochrome oxidase assembly protein ShyY1